MRQELRGKLCAHALSSLTRQDKKKKGCELIFMASLPFSELVRQSHLWTDVNGPPPPSRSLNRRAGELWIEWGWMDGLQPDLHFTLRYCLECSQHIRFPSWEAIWHEAIVTWFRAVLKLISKTLVRVCVYACTDAWMCICICWRNDLFVWLTSALNT